jgi:hypothetical protein
LAGRGITGVAAALAETVAVGAAALVGAAGAVFAVSAGEASSRWQAASPIASATLAAPSTICRFIIPSILSTGAVATPETSGPGMTGPAVLTA